jgi:penicillin-binding protein 2
MIFNKVKFLRHSFKIIFSAIVMFGFIANTAFTAQASPKAAQAKTKKARGEKVLDAKTSKKRTDARDSRDSIARNSSESRRRTKSELTSTHTKAGSAAAKKASNTPKAVAKSGSTARERNAEPAPSTRQRATELRRAEAQRRAEAERLAAIARERARDQGLRDYVQAMIAKDDLSGEDPEVRRSAVNALGNHAGTVVVMDPQSGRVYSIVNQEWAVREGFKPCSTIKLVTGLAGLNENVINSNDSTKISDANQVSLTKALAYSKNDYFQQVGEQVGFDKMVSYARKFGLGEKTGINTRNEFQGRVPGSDSRSAIHRMSSHGDNFQVTALQLATLVSAMANGGKLLSPYQARTRQDEMKFKTKVRRQINLDSNAWRNMIPGMVGAVNYGSGRRAHDPAQIVAGKTGTCIEQGTWVGLFTSYAPVANPKLAIVVITRGADARSHFPAAVAGRIYRDLSARFGTEGGMQVAATRKTYQPEEMTVALDDEEESSANEETMVPQPRPLLNTSATDDSKVRRVMLQIQNRIEATAKPAVPTNTVPTNANGITRPRRVSVGR